MRILTGCFAVLWMMTQVVVFVMIAAALGPVAQARQQSGAFAPTKGHTDAVEPDLRRQLRGLIAENQEASKRYTDEMRQLKTDAEKQAYISANWPHEKKVAGRMLELARRHPQDFTSFDALAWLAILGYNTTECDDAAKELARLHGPEKRLWLICQEMRRGVISPARGTMLRAVLEHNFDRATRGRACLDLAEYLAEFAGFIQILKTPGLNPWLAQAYCKERLDQFRALDPTKLEEDAGRLYERVLDEFADVVPIKWWTVPRMQDSDPRTVYGPDQDEELDKGTLANQARPALNELRRLALGRVAPDIEGRDIDGHPFKLSDYRGKVVVLTFSGTWCGPCQSMYPHQREIVARLKSRPFALLSVMTDEDAGPIRKEIDSGEITWRCWWERGGSHGAIPNAWNVHGYPTVYVIDPKGVIRLKFTGYLASPQGLDGPQPPIDQFLDRLLNEQKPESGAAQPSWSGSLVRWVCEAQRSATHRNASDCTGGMRTADPSNQTAYSMQIPGAATRVPDDSGTRKQ